LVEDSARALPIGLAQPGGKPVLVKLFVRGDQRDEVFVIGS